MELIIRFSRGLISKVIVQKIDKFFYKQSHFCLKKSQNSTLMKKFFFSLFDSSNNRADQEYAIHS